MNQQKEREISSVHKVLLQGCPITVIYNHTLNFGIPLFESENVYTAEKVTKEKKILGLKILNSEANREKSSSIWCKTIYLFGLPIKKTKYECSEEVVKDIEEFNSILGKIP